MTSARAPLAREPDSPRANLAATVAAAVDAVPGVRRTPGAGIPVATQYAGGSVVGVGLGDSVQVHVVASSLPLDGLTAAVHAAVKSVLDAAGDGRPVMVVVDDLEVATLGRRTGPCGG